MKAVEEAGQRMDEEVIVFKEAKKREIRDDAQGDELLSVLGHLEPFQTSADQKIEKTREDQQREPAIIPCAIKQITGGDDEAISRRAVMTNQKIEQQERPKKLKKKPGVKEHGLAVYLTSGSEKVIFPQKLR